MIRMFTTLAIVALTVAGCGDAPSENSTSATKTAGGRAKAATFSQCMRDNGVTEFPDPDASGELTVDGVLNGSSLDPDSPTWQEAISACKDLQPAGFTGKRRTVEEQDDALEFAQCMRENGVEDFPDPIKDGPLVDTNRIPSVATNGVAHVDAAMQACGDIAARIIEEQE